MSILIWIHYLATKIGRGEYLEALDGLAFIRGMVLSPLLQVKNGLKPRGVRKVEQTLPEKDLLALTQNIPAYNSESIIAAVDKCIALYKMLKEEVFGDALELHTKMESKCLTFLNEVKKGI